MIKKNFRLVTFTLKTPKNQDERSQPSQRKDSKSHQQAHIEAIREDHDQKLQKGRVQQCLWLSPAKQQEAKESEGLHQHHQDPRAYHPVIFQAETNLSSRNGKEEAAVSGNLGRVHQAPQRKNEKISSSVILYPTRQNIIPGQSSSWKIFQIKL